jgi:hypothetical protein
MKNKFIVTLMVLLILVILLTAARPMSTSTQAAESDWVVVLANECYSYKHSLGYMPLDVHAWVKLIKNATSPNALVFPYTDYAGDLLKLYTDSVYVTFCNQSLYPIMVKIRAH